MAIRCPQCDAVLEAADSQDGEQARCSACGAVVGVAGAPARSGVCPSCGQATAPDAVICVNCGLNLKTGRWVLADTEGEGKGATAGGARPLPCRAARLVAESLPGLFRPLVLIAALLAAGVGGGLLALGLRFLHMGMALSGCLLGAGGVVVHAQGMAWLVDGGLSFLPDALTDFEGASWGVFVVLVLVPLAALVAVGRWLLGSY